MSLRLKGRGEQTLPGEGIGPQEAEEVSLEELMSSAQSDDTPPEGTTKGWRRRLSVGRVRRSGASDAAQWTGGSALATRATSVVLAAALVCGPAAAIKTFVFTSDPQSVTATGGFDERMSARQGTAGDMAVRAVRDWLGASQDNSADLAAWWDVSTVQLPSQPAAVSEVRVVTALPAAPGVWSVRVAADVTVAGGEPVTRYFVVPIAVDGQGAATQARPLTLPAQIAAPGMNVDIATNYDGQVTADSGVWTTTAGFLSALLTSQGDITLYLRPGTSIPKVSPAPWASVSVQAIAAPSASAALSVGSHPDGTQIHVLATAALDSAGSSAAASSPSAGSSTSPATAAGSSVTAQYALTLTIRAGRWEVSALDAAPVLNTPSTN